MRPYGRTSGGLRAVAAFVSLGLTVTMFLLLRATSLPAPPRKPGLDAGITVFPLRRPPTEAAARPGAAPPSLAQRRSAATIGPRIALPPTLPATEPPVAASLAPAAITPPAAASSAPLRIDAPTIARAIAASEGHLRRMARQGGAELDMPGAGRSEQLAATVAEKGVPDCLAPNAGASLLSAPLILLRAIDGKCK